MPAQLGGFLIVVSAQNGVRRLAFRSALQNRWLKIEFMN
jgi:hypothetical protein